MTIISIHGPRGSGKSSLAATWKPGVRKDWFDLEGGAIRAEGVTLDNPEYALWHPATDSEEDILAALFATMQHQRFGKVEGQTPLWDSLSKKYIHLLKLADESVIIYDTWKMVWSWNTAAYLQVDQENTAGGKKIKKQLGQMDYGIPNSRMDGMIQAAKVLNRDLILISHERPIYVPGVDAQGNATQIPGPAMEPDSYKHTGGMSDWQFHSSFQQTKGTTCEMCNKKVDGDCKGFHFFIEIEKSPIGAEFMGMKIRDPSYVKLVKIVEAAGKEMP